MNRKELGIAILSWLHRASLRTPVAQAFDAAAGFIALAEQDMNERLRARCMVVRATETIDGQYTTLPCDYLEMLDLRLAGGGPPITYATRYDMAAAFHNHANNTPYGSSGAGMGPDFMQALPNPPAWSWTDGTPQRASIIGNEIEWSPFPQPATPLPAGYVFPKAEMAYYQRCALGPDDTDTNNVLATYPGIYIYGSLVHAAPFLNDDDRLQTWAGLYGEGVTMANREHERARTAGSPLRQTYRRLA